MIYDYSFFYFVKIVTQITHSCIQMLPRYLYCRRYRCQQPYYHHHNCDNVRNRLLLGSTSTSRCLWLNQNNNNNNSGGGVVLRRFFGVKRKQVPFSSTTIQPTLQQQQQQQKCIYSVQQQYQLQPCHYQQQQQQPFLFYNKYRSFTTTTTTKNIKKKKEHENENVRSHRVFLDPIHSTHLVFGANTDVGKTIITTGLIRAAAAIMEASKLSNSSPPNKGGMNQNQAHPIHHHHSTKTVHYIKPLQCGGGGDDGGDRGFVQKYITAPTLNNNSRMGDNNTTSFDSIVTTHNLHYFSRAASPHLASMDHNFFSSSSSSGSINPNDHHHDHNLPLSDDSIMTSLHQLLYGTIQAAAPTTTSTTSTATIPTTTYIETAGGVLSPSISSPYNTMPYHNRITPIPTPTTTTSSISNTADYGWRTQGDFYQCFANTIPVILIGDGKLGGISTTLSAFESLLVRGYHVTAIIMLEPPVPPNTNNNNNNDHHNDDDIGSNMMAIQSYLSNKYQPVRIGSGERILQNKYEQHCGLLTLPAIPLDSTIPLYDWYHTTQHKFQQLHQYLQTSYSTYVSDMITIQQQQQNQTIPTLHGTDGNKIRFLQTTQRTTSTEVESVGTTSSKSKSSESKSDRRDILEEVTYLDASSGYYHTNSYSLTNASVLNRYGTSSYDTLSASKYQQQQPYHFHTPYTLLTDALLQLVEGDTKEEKKNVYKNVRYQHCTRSDVLHDAIQLAILTYQKRFRHETGDQQQQQQQNHKKRHYEYVVGNQTCIGKYLTPPPTSDSNMDPSSSSSSSTEAATTDTTASTTTTSSSPPNPTTSTSKSRGPTRNNQFTLVAPTLAYQDGIVRIQLPSIMEPLHWHEIKYEYKTLDESYDTIHRNVLDPKLKSLYKESIEMQLQVYEYITVYNKVSCIVIEPVLMNHVKPTNFNNENGDNEDENNSNNADHPNLNFVTLIDPLWQQALYEVVTNQKSFQIPIVFDETFCGLHRSVIFPGRDLIQRDPDIVIYGMDTTLPSTTTIPTPTTMTTTVLDEDDDDTDLLKYNTNQNESQWYVTLLKDDIQDTIQCIEYDDDREYVNRHTVVPSPMWCVQTLQHFDSYRSLRDWIPRSVPPLPMSPAQQQKQHLPEIDNSRSTPTPLVSIPGHDIPTSGVHQMTTKKRRNCPMYLFSESYLREISQLPIVHSTFALGTILVVNLQQHPDYNISQTTTTKTTNNNNNMNSNQEHSDDDDDDHVDIYVGTILENLRTDHILARRYNKYSIGYVVSPSFTPKECDRITRILYNKIRDVCEDIEIELTEQKE